MHALGLAAGPHRLHRRPAGWKMHRRWIMPLGGLAVFFMFTTPYLLMLLSSLRPNTEVLAIPPTLIPKTWTFEAYIQVISDPRFQNWLKSSVVVAMGASVLTMLVATPAAYYSARVTFPGNRVFLGLIIAAQMFAPTVLVVGLYRLFYDLRMIDTYGPLIITNSAFNVAFSLWLLHSFFKSIPTELEEAASLDGASRVRTFLQVMLPLTLPGVVTAFIFTFIASWNEYIVALTLIQSDQLKPLTIGFSSYVTGYQQNWNELFAASLLAIVPVVILFGLIEKFLVGGMTAGAVK